MNNRLLYLLWSLLLAPLSVNASFFDEGEALGKTVAIQAWQASRSDCINIKPFKAFLDDKMMGVNVALQKQKIHDRYGSGFIRGMLSQIGKVAS